MRTVKNKKAIANISAKSLKANRLRNLVAIFAIALTALMFTALFTVGLSMMKSMEESTFRQVGTSSHGGYKFLTQEQYDIIAANDMVKDISYNTIVGLAENPQLQKVYTEIRYSEDKDAKWGFNFPTTGTMPEKYKDVATTTAVLDALGVPHKIGAQVPLEFTVDGKTYKETFTLSGFWEGDPVSPANQCFLSKEYASQVAPTNPVSIYDREVDEANPYAGTINCSVWFNNSFNIESKIDKLTTDCGFTDEDINTGVNWAYSTAEIDFQSIAMVGLVLLLILISGYLIIYNIFYISVAKDIRFYGLLKTIGTTGKQLKRIVRRQAMLLACIGIPLGLILGYIVGILLVPQILNNFTLAVMTTSANPFIFIGAALFSFFTVFLSCSKPSRVAAKVSPMEALHYTEVVSKKKKSRRTAKVSPLGMGVRNVFRSKKKTTVIILSLALSVILLNSVYSAVNSFDMDKYIESSTISDFSVADSALLTRYEGVFLEDNVAEDIKSIDGITHMSPVYVTENEHKLTAEGLKKMNTIVKECSDTFYGGSEEEIKITQKKGAVNAHIYGADAYLFDKITQYKGDFDWEKFKTGKYAIVNTYYDDGQYHYYDIGDKVPLTYADGITEEYEVMALGEIPYAAGFLHSHLFGYEFIVPSDILLSHTPGITPLRLQLEVEDSKEAAVETALEKYTEDTSVSFVSKATLVEELKGTQKMYMVVGGSLSAILALIGLLNFVNSMVTSIHSRRRELAMLQSVGMTTKQLRQMLVWEGMTYVGLTTAFCLTVGLAISVGLTYGIAGQIWFFTFHFTALPILLSIPFMVLIAWIIPVLSYHSACKESVVERLREVE